MFISIENLHNAKKQQHTACEKYYPLVLLSPSCRLSKRHQHSSTGTHVQTLYDSAACNQQTEAELLDGGDYRSGLKCLQEERLICVKTSAVESRHESSCFCGVLDPHPLVSFIFPLADVSANLTMAIWDLVPVQFLISLLGFATNSSTSTRHQ